VLVYKKRNETQHSNYGSISLLPNTHKIFSDILLSRLIPYVQEIIGDQQCGFRRNRSNIDQKFCNCPIIEKDGNSTNQWIELFVHFKKAYDSVGGWVLYNILIEFDFTMKLLRLLKMCLNSTYRRVGVGNHLSHMFPIMNGMKKWCFIATSFHLCFRIHHSEGSGETEWLEIKRYVSAYVLCWVFNTLRRSENNVMGNKQKFCVCL